MAYVICDLCTVECEAPCVDVCPADCIHPRCDELLYAEVTRLYLNPRECTDCGACAEECPRSAIFPDSQVPDPWTSASEENARWYLRGPAC